MANEDFKIDIIFEISYLNEEALLNKESSSFKRHFQNTINLLSEWVGKKMYALWEEDDVNFLNFIFHSRWLYDEEDFEYNSELLKELTTDVTYPFLLSLKEDDQFYSDSSYWFISQGEMIFNRLSLEKEREEVSFHLGKEKA